MRFVVHRVYDGYLYPSFEKVEGLSLSTLDAFEERLLRLLENPLDPLPVPEDASSHIYVCVHATRDCRCGDIGEALYQDILRFIRRKKVGGWMGTEEREGGDAPQDGQPHEVDRLRNTKTGRVYNPDDAL